MDTDNKDPQVIETDSLESPAPGAAPSAASPQPSPSPGKSSKGGGGGFKKFRHGINIYVLMFILILVISGAVLVILAFSQHTTKDPTIASQTLSSSTLSQLSKTDATVGDPKQVLNVQSNAVFAGQVLVKGGLDVAGQIHVSGSLSLPGITVSGDSTFDQVQVNKTLSIGGDESVLGQLSVKKNLTVSGGGTFGGTVTAPQIATTQLQLLGDLTMTRHIIAGGATPGKSSGGSIGAGGTTSVSGSDSAGSININTGGGTSGGSCYLSVSFTSRYNSTPHVIVTPTSAAAASTPYYITKTSSGFNICTVSAPPANSSITFDYVVIG